MSIDICMCSGGDCSQKEHCLRFTGVVYGRQDFFGTPPYLSATGMCEYFLDNRPSVAAIRGYAYALWERSGYLDGCNREHWLQAEIELLKRIERNN
jgi:Protein of unknown function (DUF2934)